MLVGPKWVFSYFKCLHKDWGKLATTLSIIIWLEEYKGPKTLPWILMGLWSSLTAGHTHTLFTLAGCIYQWRNWGPEWHGHINTMQREEAAEMAQQLRTLPAPPEEFRCLHLCQPGPLATSATGDLMPSSSLHWHPACAASLTPMQARAYTWIKININLYKQKSKELVLLKCTGTSYLVLFFTKQ